jgi:hypothetical protein
VAEVRDYPVGAAFSRDLDYDFKNLTNSRNNDLDESGEAG